MAERSKEPWVGRSPLRAQPGISKFTHYATGEFAWGFCTHRDRWQRYPELALAVAALAKHRSERLANPDGDIDPRITFGEFTRLVYLPSKPGKRSTLASRESTIRRIEQHDPDFPHLRLTKVRRNHVERLIRQLDSYTPGTIRTTIAFVGSVMNYAVANGALGSWEVKVDLPDPDPTEAPPSPEEFALLRDGAEEVYRALVCVAGVTGLRSAEARGLTLDCLPAVRWDMAAGRWAVSEQGPWEILVRLQIDDITETLVSLKTKKAARSVPFTPTACQLVVDHLNAHGTGPVVYGRLAPKGKTLVFRGVGSKGFVSGQTFHEAMARASAPTGKAFTPHSLRHFYATQCAANGVMPKELQRRLGHASMAITMDLYASFYPNDTDPAGTVMDRMLGNPAPAALLRAQPKAL